MPRGFRLDAATDSDLVVRDRVSSRAARLATFAAVPTLCRIHVGAHLPVDVLGGAAMGLAVEAFVDRILR